MSGGSYYAKLKTIRIKEATMTYRRFLNIRAQQSLVAMLIGALLLASFPAAAAEAKSPRPIPKTTRLADDPDFCAAVIPRNGPAWGDRQGWNFPEYYLNIELADIDGDDKDELLGRAGDGIKVYGWDTQNLRWVARKDGPNLDNNPYGQPQYDETLQFADVDGTKGDELLIRSPHGMLAYRHNAGADTWTLLTPIVDTGSQCTVNKLALSDACGFDKSEYYQTIQTVKLQGDTTSTLLARANDGVHFYKLDVGKGSWRELGGQVIPLSDAMNFNKPEYYQTIQIARLKTDGSTQLIVRAGDGVHAYDLNVSQNTFSWLEIPAVLGLSDGAGWNFPQNYLTIQTADLDSDGGEELLARHADGLLVYRLNTATNAWEGPDPFPLGLSDANGWNQPQYYRSVQTADVDGDKKAELIARASDGLHVYKYTQVANSNIFLWAEPKNAFTLMQDAAGWDQPGSYLTIQTGDIDGDRHPEIIGRSRKEIETVHYGNEQGLYQKKMTLMFSPFTGSQLDVYKYIGAQLVGANGVNRDDIRKEYLNSINLNNFDLTKLSNPGQFRQADWDPVYNQLTLEVAYASRVNTWFTDQSEAITKLGLKNKDSLDPIKDLLNMSTTPVEAGIALLILNAVLALGSAIPGEGAAVETVHVISELTETAIETVEGALELAGESGFQGTVAELEVQLGDRFQDALTANACLNSVYLQDWELLQSLGAPLFAGSIGWSLVEEAKLVDAGDKGFQLQTWKILTAVRWEIDDFGDIAPAFRPDEDYNYAYGYREDGQPIVRYCQEMNTVPSAPCPRSYGLVIQGRGWNYPTEQALRALFDPAPAGLGVPKEDVYLRKNGWRIPYGSSNGSGKPTAVAAVRPCLTRCFRAPEFYLWSLGRLPQGRVFVAGSYFNNQLSTSDTDAMRRVLRGGDGFGTPTPLERFNQQYVALQLNLMTGGSLTEGVLNSELNCYRGRFSYTALSNRVILNSHSSLGTLLDQARQAAQQNRATDFAALADALAALNGNDPYGHCSTTHHPPRQ